MTKMSRKSLNTIGWNVSEKVYRADKAISYSTISNFAREGFRGLKKVMDGLKLDTPAIRHGSATDTLLTESDKFFDLYAVSNYKEPSEQVREIVNLIWEESDKSTNNLRNIDKDLMIKCIDQVGYGAANWKEETKINKIITEGNDFFQMLPIVAEGKTLISQEDFHFAQSCVATLRSHPYSKWIFDDTNPDIEICYQLKLRLTNEEISPDFGENMSDIRCMYDIILVDHGKKTITPIDLKTTGANEDDFEESIIKWRYHLQSTMYSYMLRKACEKDDYFSDFTILPFSFLPINKYNLSPQLFIHEESVETFQRRFTDSLGNIHKPWYVYIPEMVWHIETGYFNYKMNTVLNKGKNIINIKYD